MHSRPTTPADFEKVCEDVEERLRLRAPSRIEIVELLADLAVLKEEAKEHHTLTESERIHIVSRIRTLIHRILAY